MGKLIGAYMTKPFDLLLGRKTYEIFAGYWPTSTEEGAEPLNRARKHVASRTLKQVVWQNSTLIPGDVSAYVRDLKAKDGPEIQVHGSGDLLQTLLRDDLVEELQIWIFPVLLGSGKRLFARGTKPAGLRAVETTTSSTGVVIVRYERAGAIAYGNLGAPDKKAT